MHLGKLMIEVKVDPTQKEKDFDLMLVDYVFFFNSLKDTEYYVRRCDNNHKFRVEFIHKYTIEDSYCVGVIEQF